MNIKNALNFGSSIVKFFTDDEKSVVESKAVNQGKVDIVNAIEKTSRVVVKTKGKVLTSEINGESAIQRLWRPMLMLSFGLIIFIAYGIFPILNSILQMLEYTSTNPQNLGVLIQLPTVVIPEQMWNLLTIGVGGYIVGRSVEKSVDKYKNGS